jgi:outer membrane protein insertion porin family
LYADTSLGNHKALFKVDEIRVEGNKKVEAEAIVEKMQIKPGMMLDNYTLRNDLKKIYSMKYFKTVEVHKKVENSKNILIVKIQEKPIISKIIFEGNDEVSSDDLKEQLKTKEYNILDVNTIKSDVVTLQGFYEEKGFYVANISYDLIENEFGGLDLVFKVKEFDSKKYYFLVIMKLRMRSLNHLCILKRRRCSLA